MRIPRVHCRQPLQPDAVIELDGRLHHYIVHVLRLTPGRQLRLFNDDACEYLCRIDAVDRRIVCVVCEEACEILAEPDIRIELFLGFAKSSSMDLSLQKATELGVAAIRPVITEYAAHRRREAIAEKKSAHWRSVVRSAAEQCGRALIPSVHAPVELQEMKAPSADALFVLHPDVEHSFVSRFRSLSCSTIAVLIGPEGGLSEADLVHAERHGFTAVHIGPRLLRVETAVTAAMSIIQTQLGDCR